MKILISVIFILFLAVSPAGAFAQTAVDDKNPGTFKHPIIDSKMSKKEAFDGLDPKCPKSIRKRQKLIRLKYYSFDGRVHQGQMVLDKDLVRDVKKVFDVALKEKFPIKSVIPISDMRFRKNGRWDDDLSMAAGNSSSFNYREITGGGRLSNHAYGRAVDLNTFQNPYIKGKISLPSGAKYDPTAPGTFTADNPIVKTFISLGWAWGGNWKSPTDYQHFEKPIK
ncbi:MAG TPA: M15 family metallopeptidase [Pyrinomonadaceae bacterium]|jgi:hypothetical protein|nr:M15 family metallopeptidase [Pyrinomonadaceae bacterium]